METYINWGPKTWVETRDSGVVKSIEVKIKGWRKINNEDGTPKTWSEITIERDAGEGLKRFFKILDTGQAAEIEETYVFTVPEEHETDKVFYLDGLHNHDHTQGDDGDVEYQEKSKEWMKLIKADSDFTDKVESVQTRLEALGET